MLFINRTTISFLFLLVGIVFVSSAQYQMEKLDRGLVAVRTGTSSVFLSWRWLGNEDNISFNVYRNGTKITATPITVCNYTDNAATGAPSYYVRPVINNVEGTMSTSATPWAQPYYSLPLQIPAGGTSKDGVAYTYSPNDCSIGDVDGDGVMEIFVKWDPSNSKDNSQSGYTGNVFIDCYKMNGQHLWRIDLGINIRAGAHYTQYLVYDFDGDGKAEMACKTADGTKDGKGVVIGSSTADYRNSSGYILSGPEFLTVFNGQTGAAMATANYLPARGTVSSWGDSYGNRVDRFIAAVAYLDGQRPSMVFGRGYYTRLVRVAWDYRNGQLTQRWTFDSNTSGNSGYAGQGNHQMTVGDVDGDGRQEINNGSCTINDNGTGLFSTTHGHGDALHMSDMDPDRPGLEYFICHEEPARYGNYGHGFYDAKTGTPIWGLGGGDQGDVGRAMAGDIDPRHKGYECWSTAGGVFNCKGQQITTSRPSVNFAVYWDGDLQRELLDGNKLDKWNYTANGSNRLVTLYLPEWGGGTPCNSTKATPNLSGDLFGDWREEIILHSADNSKLLIYTTTTPSNYKFRTLLHDPQYRVAIAWQNSGYNQPPHLGYYLGEEMTTPAKPNITIVGANSNQNPIINWNSTTPTNFCTGSTINFAVTASDNDGSIASVSFYRGATLLGTDNTSPYTYTWTNATAGSHAITAVAVDNLGATSTTSNYNIVVGVPTATITSSGTVIPYQGNKVLNASTGTGYTYQWKLNNANITNATAATYTATVAGSYTVTVTANGCSATSTALVLTAETPPQKYIYNYDNSGDYNWSNTNSWTPKAVPRAMDTVIIRTGEVRIPDMIHTAPVYIEAAGTLRLLDTSTVNQIILQGGMLRAYTSSQGFVLNTNSIKVEQASTIQSGSLAGPIFTINGPISGSADLTKNGLATLRLTTASPNYKGNWIITEGKIQVRNGQALGLCGVIAKAPGRLDIEAATTIYSLKVEDGAGVDLDNTLTVNVAVLGSENMLTGSYTNATRASYIGGTSSLIVSSSILSASGATSFCQGGSVVLTAASSSSYQWKNNGTNLVTTASYTANATGNYSVLVKNSNACSLESAPQAVTVNPAPTATVTTTTSTTFCQGGSVVLSANTGTGLTYQWRNGTSNIASATGSSYTATTAGSYNVVVSSGNCSATSTNTTVTVNALPTATITAGGTTTFCQGGSVVLSANTGTSLTYQWRNGTSNIASATGATYTATTAGSYNVVVSSGNCSATSTNTTVTVNAPISVSVTPNGIQTLIPSQPITLTATTSATGVTYTWYNGTSVVGSNSATLSVTTAGNYSVQITNGTCQATSNTVSVVNANAPLVSMISPTNNGTAVAPTNILLEAQATDSDGSITKVEFYQNNVKVGEGTGTTSYQYTLTNVAQGAYTFYAVATDNSGLQTTSASVNFTVGVNQSPIVNTFTATYNQPTPGSSSTGSIDIAVNAQDPEGGALTVEIYDGTTLLTTLTNAPYTYTYNNPSVGTHDIVVKVKDSEGNTVTQTQSVTVIPASTPTRSANSLQVTYYPNPYREVITIEGEGSMDYIVQDMRGHEVERGTINSIGQVGANLPAAQYIVILQNQDKRSVIKIEKQ
ncbi:MAG: Ig-like domain-containing protein [Cytophagaceae bacterium]